MKTKKRQKICYNCNAQVDLEVIVCPYCGTDLLEEFDSEFDNEEELDNKVLSPQQTIASLYPPPYQTHNDDKEIKEEEEEIDSNEEEEEQQQQQISNIVPSIVLNFSGSLVGLIFLLFLFSDNGEINLSINYKYLAFTLLISLPAFLWSFRALKED